MNNIVAMSGTSFGVDDSRPIPDLACLASPSIPDDPSVSGCTISS